MKGRKPSSSNVNGHREHGLHVGQTVELKRGALAGMSGVLIGFSWDHNCLIELDVVQRGVVLIINPAAVRKRPTVHASNTTPAGPGACN